MKSWLRDEGVLLSARVEGFRWYLPHWTQFWLSISRYYNHCSRVIDAYTDGFKYGTKDFTVRVYKGNWQVVDKTKC